MIIDYINFAYNILFWSIIIMCIGFGGCYLVILLIQLYDKLKDRHHCMFCDEWVIRSKMFNESQCLGCRAEEYNGLKELMEH